MPLTKHYLVLLFTLHNSKNIAYHITEVLIFSDKLMVMGNSKNSCVFNFAILLKLRKLQKFDACEIYMFYSNLNVELYVIWFLLNWYQLHIVGDVKDALVHVDSNDNVCCWRCRMHHADLCLDRSLQVLTLQTYLLHTQKLTDKYDWFLSRESHLYGVD